MYGFLVGNLVQISKMKKSPECEFEIGLFIGLACTRYQQAHQNKLLMIPPSDVCQNLQPR